MQKINLKNGKSILVDDDDFERVKDFRWHFQPPTGGENGGKARATAWRSKKIYMHHMIVGQPVDRRMSVDHVNGNGLDNRKENLRFATARQQRQNSAIRRDNVSGFKGIRFRRDRRKFVSTLMLDGKRINLGEFNTAIEAAVAYNEAAIKFFGKFARVNILQ